MGTEAYLRIGIDGTAAVSGGKVVQRSLDDISNSASGAVSQVERIKGAFSSMGGALSSITTIMAGMVSGFAAWETLKSAVNSVIDTFKSAFLAVDDFNMHVAMASATVMSFMDKSKDTSAAESWKRANDYAKSIVPTIELISARMIMTGRQASLMFVELAKGGVFLDATNKEAVKGFEALGNAVSILTSGQDPERQIMTEVRALMQGQAQVGSMLLRMLEAMDPLLKQHSEEWKKSGTYLQNMKMLLEGFSEATTTLAGLWKAVSTTIGTLVTQILRGGMEQTYVRIMFLVSGIRDFLTEHRDILAGAFQKALLTVVGLIETWWTLIKPFGPMYASIAYMVNLIADGLGIISYVILPVMAKIIVGILSSLDHMLQLARNFGLTMLDAIGAAGEAVGSLGKAVFQALTGNFEDAKRTLQGMFSGDYATRFVDNAKKLGGSVKDVVADVKSLWTSGQDIGDMLFNRYQEYTAGSKLMHPAAAPVPAPGPGTPEKDNTIKAQLKLDEARMKAELDYIKKTEELSRSYWDNQFTLGEISYQKIYDTKYNSFVKENDKELDVIAKQIEEAEKAKGKIQPGPTAKKDEIEIETKIVEYEAKAADVRLSTAKKLQGLNMERIKELKKEFDLVKQNQDMKDKVALLGTQVEENPYAQQMETIRQRYALEIEWQQKLVDSTKAGTNERAKAEERLALLQKAQAQEVYIFQRQTWRDAAASAASSLDQLGQIMMHGNKSQFETGKKMAIASTLISTYLGAQQAYTALSGIPIVGPALGVAAAIAAIAAGLSRVEDIRKQQYTGKAEGGFISPAYGGTPGKDSVPAMLMPGEFVVKKDAVDHYGLDTLNRINAKRFADGGPVGMPNTFNEFMMATSVIQESKTQRAQLDATQELISAVKENTHAVTKVADGMTSITGIMKDAGPLFLKAMVTPGSMSKTEIEKLGDIFSKNMDKFNNSTVGQIVNVLTLGSGYVTKILGSIGTTFLDWAIGGKKSLAGQGLVIGYQGGQVTGGQYVETHTSSGLFSHGHNDISTSAFPSDLAEALNTTLSRIKDSISNAAQAIGADASNINKVVVGLTKLNLKGMGAEDAQKAIEDWLKTVANTMVGSITGIEKLQKPGEALFDTLIRLSSALQVVNENAKLFGGTVLQASLDNADASSQLVESMGGMDEYLSKTGKYFSNFYSDVEQSQAKAGLSLQQITAVLHNVGLSVPMTAEGFKELVGSLDITTENGRDAYAALMSVADAADAVYKNSKRIADDTNDLYRDLTSRRLSAEGNTYAATMYDVLVKQQKERLEVEAKGLKDTTLYTDLLAVQQLEYASAAKEAAKSTSELSKSLGALVDDQTKILETMRNIMTGGSQLSPEAAYQAAQQNFAAVTSATVPDASAISSAATALLDASKNYNASGVAYQNDVQNVLTTLGQMVDTAPTIDAVTKQVDILNQIKQSIDTGNLTQLQSLLSILDQNTKIAKGISDFLGTIPSSAGGTGTSSTGSLPPVNTRSTDWASTAATMLTNNLTQTVPVYIAQKFIPPGSSKIAQNAINAVIPQGSTTFLKPIDTPIGMEQYDVAPPYGTLDQADIDLLKKMASGGAALPTYAVGSAYLQTDQFAQVHQGESIIDARSNEVLQKYGIRVQTISSSGNKDEEIALLKEQNAHLAAMVRLLQAFASKSIELDEKQLKQLGTMVSKTRLENAA